MEEGGWKGRCRAVSRLHTLNVLMATASKFNSTIRRSSLSPLHHTRTKSRSQFFNTNRRHTSQSIWLSAEMSPLINSAPSTAIRMNGKYRLVTRDLRAGSR